MVLALRVFSLDLLSLLLMLPLRGRDAQTALDREQAKAKRLALIIIGRLSQTVTRMLQVAIPEEEYFNPVDLSLACDKSPQG